MVSPNGFPSFRIPVETSTSPNISLYSITHFL
nr:MAG TPA: hypothetical protein [Caudoviricetes sp.]